MIDTHSNRSRRRVCAALFVLVGTLSVATTVRAQPDATRLAALDVSAALEVPQNQLLPSQPASLPSRIEGRKKSASVETTLFGH